MVDTTGQANLRAETITATVNGFALQEYKFKQACAVNRSNSWKESYYQEGATELTGGTGSAIKGVPRLAAFPYGEPNWTKTSAYLEKYGMEGVISWEDQMYNEVDVIARTLLRISRAVTKAVDDQIFSALTTATGVQTFTITATKAWSNLISASGANVIDDLMRAKQMIKNYNYNSDNAYIFVNQRDHRSIVRWLAEKGAQFPSISANVTSNGNAGSLAGLNIVVSNSVTASGALVIVKGEAATWKEAVPLTVKTIEDPGIKTTIRAWEIGVTQVTNPYAIVWIKGTDDGTA
ncbi:hypothetical protein M0R04_15675 [Candidatus Dojkabacteria bacterium]|jgi:hypothetical protein|nr:hypothetical protein [Candidatus Dojkabacteria bacterium]